jgi:hypothetical protein
LRGGREGKGSAYSREREREREVASKQARHNTQTTDKQEELHGPTSKT